VLLTALAAATATRLYTTAENRYIKEAFPIRSSVHDMLVQMLNQETGVRGYLITGNRLSLAPYYLGRSHIQGDVATLEGLTARRPEIAGDVGSARRLIHQLEAFYMRQVALVDSGSAGQLRAQRSVFAGKALFDQFRRTTRSLIGRSNTIVEEAKSSQRNTYWTTIAIALTAGTAAAAIAVWLLLSVPRRIWSLYDIERGLRDAAERGARASRSLEHVEDAVILLDPDGTIRYWNPAAAAYFDVAEPEALGRAVTEVVPDFAEIERLLDGGAHGEATHVSRNGSERRLVARETTFAEGRVIVLRDTTSEFQLERARSEFVATASHELRTPLAAVYGAVRTLRRPDRPADADLDGRLLAMIETESDRLTEIVEQILVTAEIDRREIRVRAEECDVRALCEEAIDVVQLRAPPGIRFVLEAPQAISIEIDAAKLRQVVLNLLDNAVKFSPAGGVVTVAARAAPDQVVIEIGDEGIGIPPDAQERIFEKFFRLDPEMRLGVGGSGLGLYISRELVERMRGRLTVQSRPGGSTFTVELPA
jgi:PAS domain S-box-containing protein